MCNRVTSRIEISLLSILLLCEYMYRRIPRLRPPFVHARIGQKWGGGLYAGSKHFRVTTITDRRMPYGRAISVLSLAIWWAKLEKNNKVRHNMTQIASLLAVATVIIDLWTPFYSQGGGGLIRETKLPLQELELKMQGGLMREGGRNRGILRYTSLI